MHELRGQSRFTPESRDRFLVFDDVRVKHLERHLALQREVARAPYAAERPAPEKAKDLVVITNGPAQALFIGHRAFRNLALTRTAVRGSSALQTLIGRARGKRFVALSGEDRIVFDQDLSYVEEESVKHRRKGSGGDD